MKIFNFITHTHNKYTKKVAILIPYYNNSKTISTPLKSFLKLKYPHKLLKIIICDDCSNIEGECEKLNEIVQGYKKHFDITIYQNKTNVGSALNRAALFNHLLKEKDIEYFAYVDADDKLKPKFFNCCFDVQIKNDYKYDVVCAFKIRSKFGHKKIANFLKLDTWSLWGKLYKTSWYASTFYSTKIANYTEDLTFWYININIKRQTCLIHKKLYIYVKNCSSMSHERNNFDKNGLDLCRNCEIILKDKNYYFCKLVLAEFAYFKSFYLNYFQSKGGEIYEDFKKALNTAI